MNSTRFNLLLILFLLISLEGYSQQVNAPGNWEKSWQMKPGIFRVLNHGQVGIVDINGKLLVPCQFDQVYDLTDDGYVRVLKDLKIGLYHLDKGLILPAEYDQIWPFNGELAKVLKNKKMGYVNKNGLMVIPVEYNHIWPEEDGLIKILKDGKMGFFDTSGKIVLPAEYQQIWSFEEGMARVLKDGKMGYTDKAGNIVVPPIYDQVWPFKDGKAKVIQSGLILFIDKQGKIVEAPEQQAPKPEAFSDTAKINQSNPPRNNQGVNIGNERFEMQRNDNSSEFIIKHNQKKKRKSRSFSGHLASVNLGINSYVDENGNENVPSGYSFMELNHEKSVELTVYPVQQDLKLIGSSVGLVTAMGLKFNNYRFDLTSPNQLNDTGLDWFPTMPENAEISKSKLTNLFLTVPLLLEIQIPDGRNRNGFYIAGGIEGELRLRSHTKVIYTSGTSRFKRKNKDDFNLNGLRYCYIARAGFKNVGIYGSYSPVSLFKNNKGPELYPYSIGVSFNF